MDLDKNIQNKINTWLEGDFNEETKNELKTLLNENKIEELNDAFYKDLEFGTGGLRGIMGVGTNRMNIYTVGRATQGFANHLKQKYHDNQLKVALTHDCRNNHKLFADTVANVFTANNIDVYYFDEMRPTPQLSHAIRHLNCQGGVMLTASHNPKEYNGYKAYGPDGTQLVSPLDQEVMNEVKKVKMEDVLFEKNEHRIHSIGKELDELFIRDVLSLSLNPASIKSQHDLCIVYSPIHGVGRKMIPRALKTLGFTNIHTVPEQMIADGNFPTVNYPNPEEKEALTLSLKLGEELKAKLIMATDPDADRVGIAIPDPSGEYILLNGNQTLSLAIYYAINQWKKQGRVTGKEYIIKTIVSSYLSDKIAEKNGVECYNTLTGFKHMGKLMTQLEGQKKYIIGGEESYGILAGDHVRDKDAVSACTLIAEMAAYYQDLGMSLYDALIEMYLEYGYYKEKLIAITKKGKSGADEIKSMMERYRSSPPKNLGGKQVVMIKDYLSSKSLDTINRQITNIDLPQSNVLQFITEDGSIVSARPSGTEPKIKFYCSVNAPLPSKDDFAHVDKNLDQKLDQLMSDLIN